MSKIKPLNIEEVNKKLSGDAKVKREVLREVFNKRRDNGNVDRVIEVVCKDCKSLAEIDYGRFMQRTKYTCKNCNLIAGIYGKHCIKHNLRKHPLYPKYYDMLDRCYNENTQSYKYYGARGITVCQEWKEDFISFYNWSIENGWKNELSIDRVNNNGNYEPSNCRWTTDKQQNRNKRNTKLNEKDVEYIRKKLKTPTELAKIFKVSTTNIYNILNKKIWK